MGAGVDNGILHMIVREIVAGFAGVKGELENLHARIAGALEKLLGRGCDIAQVLRDDRDVAEFFFHSAEEVLAGSFDNLAVLGGLVTVRDLVVFRKSVEVVQADDIVELKVAGKALDPPAVPVFFEFFPVVDRIAPELACGREGIRRAARHYGRDKVFVKAEDVGVSPGRRAVHGHIEGNITDDFDPLLFGIGMEFFPLAVKLKLQEAVEIDLLRQFLCRCVQGFGVAEAFSIRPVCPGFPLIFFLQTHIEGIVKEPVMLSLQIFLVLSVVLAVVRGIFQGAETVKGDAEHGVTVVVHCAVIDFFRVASEVKAVHFVPGQESLFNELLQVYKIGISRKRRD